ncbi:MAG: 3-dehydroquinate synthase [Proteobacteria bacterium]|nr:3-dehydroquinate synthase [Pseudomonadota bacterium]NIS72354.1 3-dehydroquinate synthase [Pseudomonadota bacterium]
MEKIDLILKREEKLSEIFIGFGLIQFLVDDLKERPLGNRLGIITDTRVENLVGYRLHQQLTRAGIRADVIVIKPGEASKRWETVSRVFGELFEKGFDRKSGLIALGGGVVGDVTGFVASLYMRSIPCAQVPTTLLAQVDSSLGGKNGIDLSHGKNLLGTIYQPRRVYVDPSILESLSEDEFRNGLAEVVKSAVVRSRELFQLLEDCHDAISERQPKVLEEMVSRCCRIKSHVVMADENDTGFRRILNFGHTVGHAVEAYTNYRVPHGVAVSIGMAVETILSTRMGALSHEDNKRIINLLRRYDLPTRIPRGYDTEKILGLMVSDKKAEDGRIAIVLPTTIGDAVVRKAVPDESIREAFREVQA